MNTKQAELAIILDEIYIQTKQYQNIDVLSLDPETLDRMHKEKLEYIRIYLRTKLIRVDKFGHPDPGMSDKLKKKIELFEDMG